ncbi:MAG TPA: hypothetical protein VE465_02190 [Streptosporangiaceae bacterium]|nr:hypothetical protein [Streptosporangiaceae bacterium]
MKLIPTDLDRLSDYIDNTEDPRGVTRTHIAKDLFRNRIGRADLDQLLNKLATRGPYEAWQERTRGRPRTWIRRRPTVDSWEALARCGART